MKAFLVRVLMPVGLLGLATTAWAGDINRLGTAGAQELRIPVGAASIAIGGSAVAVGNGLQNIYYNPASLASTDESEAIVSFSSYLADATVNYAGASTRLGSQGNLGIAVKILNIGDITVTTEDSPAGTGEILSPNFGVIGLTYARRMTDRVLLGFTSNFINETVAQVSAHGVAFDLGVQYDTGWHGMRFGFCMKNIGPEMSYSGQGFETKVILPGDDPAAQPHVVSLEAAKFELPAYLQLGVTYEVMPGKERNATLYATFQGNNLSTDEYRLGAQFNVNKALALRGGYTGQTPFDSADRQPDYLYNWTYGAGFAFKLGTTPLNLDWSGTVVNGFFSDNQQVSLSAAF
jgi:long-subunit fatty acid transport protein